jgi:LytS/YehU family sensor histidine kinase
MLGAAVLAGMLLRRVWHHPSRRTVNRAALTYGAVMLLFGGAMAWRLDDRAERWWAFGVCWGAGLLVAIALHLLSLYRADVIEARLRELDERDRRADMARQLAQAQIQPHFLFNSLASLQHWVQTKDDRAAPMLEALTGFLRATLPLFDRPLLALGEEAQAVRHYLAVMQMRLGDRLRWRVEIAADTEALALPAGLLLTLVENALEHGIQPSVSGGEVLVTSLRLDATRWEIAVRDSGVGLARETVDGVGLTNARARLAQAFGHTASLVLSNAPEGGCMARLEAPARQP